MICKEVSYNLAMDEWGGLLDRDSLSAEHAKTARMHLAGLKAEKEMAYHLDAHFGGNPELLVFNDIKFEHRGLTAQIDHLVLSRWSAYFIETKSVSQKININADGQWARVYGKKYVNFESPLEQSRRHESILFDLLESRLADFMGKLLGFQKTFRKVVDVQHLIAISVGAAVQGKGRKAVSGHLQSWDQVPRLIRQLGGPTQAEHDCAFDLLSQMGEMVASELLDALADPTLDDIPLLRKIHRQRSTNWEIRFGIANIILAIVGEADQRAFNYTLDDIWAILDSEFGPKDVTWH